MDHLEQLLMDVKESLERQLDGLDRRVAESERTIRQELREGFAGINTRFDTQSTRLDRHAAL